MSVEPTLDDLRGAAATVARTREQLAAAEHDRDDLIRALRLHRPRHQLAAAAGITAGRVSHIIIHDGRAPRTRERLS